MNSRYARSNMSFNTDALRRPAASRPIAASRRSTLRYAS
jgi:hypothetical protein